MPLQHGHVLEFGLWRSAKAANPFQYTYEWEDGDTLAQAQLIL